MDRQIRLKHKSPRLKAQGKKRRITMATFYHFCHTCKAKGEPITEKEADAYLPVRMKGKGKPSPICCGKPMVLHSDDFLAGTFSINTRP